MKNFEENKKFIFLALIIIATSGLLYYVLFFNPNNFFSKIGKSDKIIEKKIFKPNPKLDENLNEILKSADIKQAAIDAGLAVTDDGIKVLVTVNDDSFIFTADYGKQVLRYGKFIQAIVKFNAVENLATNPKVSSVTAPKAGN